VHSTHFLAELVVDRVHDTSSLRLNFQHSLVCILPCYTRIMHCRPCWSLHITAYRPTGPDPLAGFKERIERVTPTPAI